MMIAPTTDLAESDSLALCSILEAMVTASKKLMRLLQDEKCCIIAGDVDQLIHLSSEKEATIEQLAKLNQDRIAVLQTNHHNDPPTKLSTLISLCPGRYRSRLQTAHTRLEALSAGIQELNQMNGLLTDRVLRQISGLLGVLKQLGPAGPTYEQSGLIQALPTTSGRTFGKG